MTGTGGSRTSAPQNKMTEESNASSAAIPKEVRPERRATDRTPLKFEASTLKALLSAGVVISENDIETIDMDSVLPPGHGDFQNTLQNNLHQQLNPEQSRDRIPLVKFKQTFSHFAVTSTSQVTASNIKRGDVAEIKTIVGSVYVRILDRIQGVQGIAGEILCECRYDLPDQWRLVHAASITLPVCTKRHVIENPDGSRRFACRALKITTDQELPERVKNLLSETFFTEILIYSNPQPERLRLIDLLRWLKRIALKIIPQTTGKKTTR